MHEFSRVQFFFTDVKRFFTAAEGCMLIFFFWGGCTLLFDLVRVQEKKMQGAADQGVCYGGVLFGLMLCNLFSRKKYKLSCQREFFITSPPVCSLDLLCLVTKVVVVLWF